MYRRNTPFHAETSDERKPLLRAKMVRRGEMAAFVFFVLLWLILPFLFLGCLSSLH